MFFSRSPGVSCSHVSVVVASGMHRRDSKDAIEPDSSKSLFCLNSGFLRVCIRCLFFWPGIWIIGNQYWSVFSPSDGSLSILMLPRWPLFRISSSGLWSVATTKVSQTEYNVTGGLQSTNHSQCIPFNRRISGFYCACEPATREHANTIFHPVAQHIGVMIY